MNRLERAIPRVKVLSATRRLRHVIAAEIT